MATRRRKRQIEGAQKVALASNVFAVAKETVSEFQRHKTQWLAAAISYFTLLAIAPLIIVLIEITGLLLSSDRAASTQLYDYMSSTAGPTAAHGIQTIVAGTLARRKAGTMAQLVGWTLFLVAVIGLFSSLQEALNTVWDIEPRRRTLLATVQQRLFSFGTVLVIAFLLLVSLGLNTLLTLAGSALAHLSPTFPTLLKILDFFFSLGLVTTLFALIFEFLPERRMTWGDVWSGAAVSALLFVVGQFLIGWYLGRAGVSSAYGSFGGIVVFMIWVNYSAQIMLFGAEFTHVYARRFGSLKPASPA